MAKLRLWVCPCCKACWHRRKTDRVSYCRTCDSMGMRKAYVYPVQRRTRCKHQLQRDRKLAFESRYHSVVRKANGHAFKPSARLRKMWKLVVQAKQKRSVISRGRIWLDQLAKEANTGQGMARSLGTRKVLRYRIKKGTPALEFKVESTRKSPTYTLFGTYGGDNCIEIHNTHNGLDQMRDTLVHESLHFLDSLALMPSGHGGYWVKRLRQMSTWFPKGEVE